MKLVTANIKTKKELAERLLKGEELFNGAGELLFFEESEFSP